MATINAAVIIASFEVFGNWLNWEKFAKRHPTKTRVNAWVNQSINKIKQHATFTSIEEEDKVRAYLEQYRELNASDDE